jgi:hypothetical protein
LLLSVSIGLQVCGKVLFCEPAPSPLKWSAYALLLVLPFFIGSFSSFVGFIFSFFLFTLFPPEPFPPATFFLAGVSSPILIGVAFIFFLCAA